MRTRNRPHTLDSLLALTVQDGTCLVWQGTKRSNGYGVTTYRGVQTTTHRVMYLLTHGEIPNDAEVDHTCNRRDCINPDHLQSVTHDENMRLSRQRRTHCRAGHEWTEANTHVATVKRKQGGTRQQRYCRKCRAEYQAKIRNNNGGLVK